MQLSKIRIRNYRLLIDAELEVDPKTTLIVGRNNTAKTSCFVCIGNVLEGKNISFNDYPLLKREDFYTKIALFMEKKLSYEDLCKQVEVISIDFLVDYSLDDPDDNLGALSPFIIDVDVDTTTALIRAEYRLKTDEKTLRALLESSYYKDGAFSPNEEAHDVLADNFGKLFGLTVYAINPNNLEDKQVKSQKELHDLFPFHAIPAERVLGEDDAQNSSLGSLISGFFDMSEGDLDPEVAEEIKRLRTIVEKANKDVQKQSDEILSAVVNSSIGFGYPNIEELKLGVTTQLSIDDQIKNQTKLSYISGTANESLPSSYNGLGYKNLIKMEFLLAAFAKDIEKRGVHCFIKHCALNESETARHGVGTWVNEQALRENYLRAFEIGIEDGGAYNVMTSFNRLGTIATATSADFTAKFLRSECGLPGIVETDCAGDMTDGAHGEAYLSRIVNVVNRATDLNEYNYGVDSPDYNGSEYTFKSFAPTSAGGNGKYGNVGQAMREASKYILYSTLTTNAMNSLSSDSRIIRITPAWQKAVIAVDSIVSVAFAATIVWIVVTWILDYRKKAKKAN